MTETVIIGIDPGKKTGVGIWDNIGGTDSFESYEMDVEEFWGWFIPFVHEHRAAGRDVRLVCESFIITIHTAKNTQATWSLELIGLVKYVGFAYGCEVTLQSPSVGKSFGTDGKLRLMGWWKKGAAGHANDAARHLVTYMANRKFIPVEKLIELAEA